MAKCTECGEAIAAGDVVCGACGAEVVVTRECENCDREYDASEEACPACGQLVTPVACPVHPASLASGHCVVCGTPACDECRKKDVVHYLCPRHHDVPVFEGWAQVYTTSDDVEAHLIRENLQAEGIDAEVLSQKDHTLTVDIGDLSPVRILVPAWRYEDARTVIEEHKDSVGEVAFACPECGVAYEPGDEVCSACGATLPEPAA